MLKFYVINEDSVESVSAECATQNPSKLVWIDMLFPNSEEEHFVEKFIGIGIPTRDEMHEIELSSRLYQRNGSVYATATIVSDADSDDPTSNAITFVLTNQCLITVRYSNPKPFELALEGFSNSTKTYHGNTILTILLDAIVDEIADILESIGHKIDNLIKDIFRPKKINGEKPGLEETLKHVSIIGDLTSKAGESLISINRFIAFISQTSYFDPSEESKILQLLLRDINALSDHSSFLNDKVSFLLNAILGMISIEQNTIIKIFSVAAVVFLPPTLVASIYGMNFHFIPELKWEVGYPMALILMVLSSVLPYKYFRQKGWL
jgi:magnesium transporter